MISRQDISAAYERIAPHIRRTPIIDVSGADFGLPGHTLTLKLEMLQHAGSFKTRGAFTHLLTHAIPAAGVVAASGGNHGVAVAYAAMQRGVPARIFVPKIASPAKIEQIKAYRAELEIIGSRYADTLAASERWVQSSSALPVHAYDQRETLLGQGTVALEIARQSPLLDTLLVAVGGGGLIGGVASWYGDEVAVVGVEPERAPTLSKALAAGEPVDVEVSGVAADSLGAKRFGALSFPIVQRHVQHAVLVTDDAIREAQRRLWQTLRLAVEPGGATALAALLSGRYVPQPRERIGVLICGANTDAVKF